MICTLVSQIFYLDHLHRKPVKWGVFPRVKIWNSLEIRATLMEDKLTRDEYGKLLALDIAYSEEHPLVTKDADCVGRNVSLVTDTQKMNVMVTYVMDNVKYCLFVV